MADNTDGRKFPPAKCCDVDDLNQIRIGKVVSKLFTVPKMKKPPTLL